LIDEMYPATLADALRAAGVDACTASELGLAGRSDPDVFAAATAGGYAVLTENVADFARISAEHLSSGRHHAGVLIALSFRFSRRPAGRSALVAAIRTVAAEPIDDRVVYLKDVDHG
jgi:Domain of unknown function (DUF5615)